MVLSPSAVKILMTAWLTNNPTVIPTETVIMDCPTSIPFELVVIPPACERPDCSGVDVSE